MGWPDAFACAAGALAVAWTLHSLCKYFAADAECEARTMDAILNRPPEWKVETTEPKPDDGGA